MTMQPTPERAVLAAMGTILGQDVLDAVYALYRDEQDRLAAAEPVALPDAAYGADLRQTLDLYVPQVGDQPVPALAPVMLWVHGGGFVRGEKRSSLHPFNAHAGRWAARNGMIGAVMNYRLAPDHRWPTGGEDVGAAIDWLRAHSVKHGGDPGRIVAVGSSAGAVHLATHLKLRGADGRGTGLSGAVLLSGLYGFTPLDPRDELYFGAPEDYRARMPRDAVVATSLPLLIAGAQYDPPRFQTELAGLLAARLAQHGVLPRSYIASGHNHFSLAYHLGTTDTRLGDEILSFIGDRQ